MLRSGQKRIITRQEDSSTRTSINPEAGWRTLTLVADWIKHAEAKAVATLGSCGVLGGILYALVKGLGHRHTAVVVSGTVSMILIIMTGTCASIALRPRLRPKDQPDNPLYYDHIARKHQVSAHSYQSVMTALARDSEALMNAIAEQIWATSHTARVKYQWANRGIILLPVTLASLAITAVLSIVGN